ncbi:hypothetical protein [Cohnella silvisoli]|uniref:Uncharacterized protein n=1 Tax=Cohnella silvisoli TaxID=2873699 RepID=A0ABV1KYL6_9BACL|nr:hypothetical protein [Cohnella silvisoli]MCD9024375.1 hypothetical protein [Cohnella silvisoli]
MDAKTVEEFIREWYSVNDWLPRQILQLINGGVRTKTENDTFYIYDEEWQRWLTVALKIRR